MRYCMVILLALASFSAFAGPYKWVDDQGKLHITDTPPPPNVKAEKLHSSTTSAGIPQASAPASAPTIFEREAELNKEKKARDEAAQKAAKEKEQADEKQRNCDAARSQLQVLQNAPRVTVYDEKGERAVLDDDARQKRINDAQDTISKACN